MMSMKKHSKPKILPFPAMISLLVSMSRTLTRIAIAQADEHELEFNETPEAIVGLFFTFTFVTLKGPNKSL